MDALFDVANRMAQDLRDYADAAAEAGATQVGTEALLLEFDQVAAEHMGLTVHQVAGAHLEGVS